MIWDDLKAGGISGGLAAKWGEAGNSCGEARGRQDGVVFKIFHAYKDTFYLQWWQYLSAHSLTEARRGKEAFADLIFGHGSEGGNFGRKEGISNLRFQISNLGFGDWGLGFQVSKPGMGSGHGALRGLVPQKGAINCEKRG